MRAQSAASRTTSRTALILLAAMTAVALGGCASGRATTAARPDNEPLAEPNTTVAQPVSVGYGTQDRREITAAISSVTSCDGGSIERSSRVEEMLQGRVAGVDVFRRSDGGLSVRIRGARSFVGRSEPLYVLDGMPLNEASSETALMGIPPQDVARIDVLKDAAATAIYGSRGMNGVVLITTHRGKRAC